jgi:hypothetical protein
LYRGGWGRGKWGIILRTFDRAYDNFRPGLRIHFSLGGIASRRKPCGIDFALVDLQTSIGPCSVSTDDQLIGRLFNIVDKLQWGPAL